MPDIAPGALVMLVGHSQGGMTAAALAADPGKHHSLGDTYAVAAADLPAGDPSYAAWRESARGFLNPASQTSSTGTYAITRESGP